MAKQYTLTLTVRFKWWVKPYINSLILFCNTAGLEPDIEKVTDFIVSKGIYFKRELR
jgi:hypothetical protein